MPHTSRSIVLRKIATLNADFTSEAVNIPEWCTAVLLRVKVGTASGTSPTVNTYLQQGFPNAISGDTVYQTPQAAKYSDWAFFDFASGVQITATNQSCIIRIVGGGKDSELATDGTLAADTIHNGPIGPVLRLKLDVGGTNPSFTNAFAILELIP